MQSQSSGHLKSPPVSSDSSVQLYAAAAAAAAAAAVVFILLDKYCVMLYIGLLVFICWCNTHQTADCCLYHAFLMNDLLVCSSFCGLRCSAH